VNEQESETDRLAAGIAAAHQQLLERDLRIRHLEQENMALRTHLESVLRTRARRLAEQFRALRRTIGG
jgi:hypothetical protein